MEAKWKILGRERRGNTGYSKWEKEREETRVQNGMQGEGKVSYSKNDMHFSQLHSVSLLLTSC